jgi:hypothetical protein
MGAKHYDFNRSAKNLTDESTDSFSLPRIAAAIEFTVRRQIIGAFVITPRMMALA